jgi:hypothetical protein
LPNWLRLTLRCAGGRLESGADRGNLVVDYENVGAPGMIVVDNGAAADEDRHAISIDRR